MPDKHAQAAGKRLFLHGALCIGLAIVASTAGGIVALWGSVPLGVAIGALALGGCGGWGWYLTTRLRFRCPECGSEHARIARDTLNRQLLVCPDCGYRAATGKRALADSPFGH